jgi:hypothetical protein
MIVPEERDLVLERVGTLLPRVIAGRLEGAALARALSPSLGWFDTRQSGSPPCVGRSSAVTTCHPVEDQMASLRDVSDLSRRDKRNEPGVLTPGLYKKMVRPEWAAEQGFVLPNVDQI